jgi:AbrB family looped-hinge helix DNA binding protein
MTAMHANVDKRGRVVIPKKLRVAKGLTPGTRVEFLPTKSGVAIVLSPSNPYLAWENGVLVYKGPWPKDLDVTEFIERQREERIRQLCGLDK